MQPTLTIFVHTEKGEKVDKTMIWVSAIEDIAIMALWIELATYFGMWWLALVGVLCIVVLKNMMEKDV